MPIVLRTGCAVRWADGRHRDRLERGRAPPQGGALRARAGATLQGRPQHPLGARGRPGQPDDRDALRAGRRARRTALGSAGQAGAEHGDRARLGGADDPGCGARGPAAGDDPARRRDRGGVRDPVPGRQGAPRAAAPPGRGGAAAPALRAGAGRPTGRADRARSGRLCALQRRGAARLPRARGRADRHAADAGAGVIPRATRLESVVGFGIDAVAAAVSAPGTLRLENLDTDLPLPPEAVAVTRAALDDPASNSWLPFTGDHRLREAISDRTLERHGRRYGPEREIVITCGGTEAVLDILLATVNPGDEVVLTDPIYAGLVNRVRLAGGVPAFAPLAVVDGEWRLDADALAAAVTPRTVAVLMMSPSMPSGCVLDRADWEAVASLCVREDLFLIYDAAMEALLFDGRELVSPLALDGMAERTVIVGSMSKEHRMIGWRVGWIAGPESVVRDAGWVHVYNTTTPVAVARRAAEAVLRGPQGHVAEAAAELQRRRDAILAALPGWPIVRPAGGWSLLVDVAALHATPAEAPPALLAGGGAATGMTGWGAAVAARHVRFVFSAEPVERLAGLARLLEMPLA